jgi:hypothetical protein
VTAVPSELSGPSRPKVQWVVIDKRFCPLLGPLHAAAKQVSPANDMVVIPEDVDLPLRNYSTCSSLSGSLEDRL